MLNDDLITLEQVDAVNFKVYLTFEQSLELKEFFSYFISGYKFSPKFKSHSWDGKISFFDIHNQHLPIGLYKEFIEFCTKFQYKYNVIADVNNLRNNITPEQIKEFLKELFEGSDYTPRDYQEDCIIKAITNKRGVMELVTGAGKSLNLYVIIRYILATIENPKILLVVPNINLVNQMFNDFKDYGFEDVLEYTGTIYSGSSNYTFDKPITISTYQSICKRSPQFFKDVDAVLVDECHGCKSITLKTILKKCINATYRFGCTGTMPTDLSEYYTIIGYVGPKIFDMKYSELIDKGVLSKLKIINLFLKYPANLIKQNRYKPYEDELKLIYDYTPRYNVLKYIIDHLPSTDNILILCHKIDHLKQIKKYVEDLYVPKGYTIYETYGKTKADDREDIRQTMDKEEKNILVGTYSTIGQGWNCKRIHHVIMASSYRSKIKVLQSIGRGLRLHESKDMLLVWDLIDDLRWTTRNGNVRSNHIYQHYEDRLKYYTEHGFEMIGHDVNLQSI